MCFTFFSPEMVCGRLPCFAFFSQAAQAKQPPPSGSHRTRRKLHARLRQARGRLNTGRDGKIASECRSPLRDQTNFLAANPAKPGKRFGAKTIRDIRFRVGVIVLLSSVSFFTRVGARLEQGHPALSRHVLARSSALLLSPDDVDFQ